MVDILRGVDLTLIKLLRDNITFGIASPESITVEIKRPDDVDRQKTVTLFNYNTVETSYSKIQKFTFKDENITFPPLILDLQYVLVLDTAEEDEIPYIKQRVYETFHENPIISGEQLSVHLRTEGGTIVENNENSYLKLALKSVSIETLNHFWSLFPGTKFRTCIFFEITPVVLPSTRTSEMIRVREKKFLYGEIND